ncbi:MAG: hypothetical protein JXN65_10035 [Clostridia bacterium]|nr:hypothetical protein [Clostridia bacterium]
MKNSSFLIIFSVLAILGAAAIVVFSFSLFSYIDAKSSLDGFLSAADHINESVKYSEHLHENKKPVIGSSTDYSEYLYSIEEEGVAFLSELDFWNDSMLNALAGEFLGNTHGDEMKLISEVIISSEAEQPLSAELAPSYLSFDIPLILNDFFSADSLYKLTYRRNSIIIYGCNEETDVRDTAFDLSRAYGEYFVKYYFRLSGTSDDTWQKYYRLRAKNYDQVITDMSRYDGSETNKKWCLIEIAANDYVFFMGSPSTKEVYAFYDSTWKPEIYRNNNDKLDNPYYLECRNATPHSNVAMPLPNEVIGLADYFFHFVGQVAPEYTEVESLGTLNLKMEKPGINQHYFTWDQPYTGDGICYTLIGYDTDDNAVVMVATNFRQHETGSAQLGKYSGRQYRDIQEDKKINFYYEEGAQMKFRISITFPDGTVVLSDPIIITY